MTAGTASISLLVRVAFLSAHLTPSHYSTHPVTSKQLRLLFASAILALPAHVLFRAVVDEPYPGLYLPGFGGTPRQNLTTVTREPRITVLFRDGRKQHFGVEDILPPTPILPAAIFSSAFYSEKRANDPQTRAWLRARIVANTGQDPRSVIIEWEQVRYRLVDGSRDPIAVLKTLELHMASTT